MTFKITDITDRQAADILNLMVDMEEPAPGDDNLYPTGAAPGFVQLPHPANGAVSIGWSPGCVGSRRQSTARLYGPKIRPSALRPQIADTSG
jgi:hypothetical protein